MSENDKSGKPEELRRPQTSEGTPKHYEVKAIAQSHSRLTISAKQKRPGFGGFLVSLKQGWNTSSDGMPAKFVQIVDRLSNRYKKWVQREDGTVVKDVEGPLDDQSLHGKQK